MDRTIAIFPLLCAIAMLGTGAAAQGDVPKGWFLHDDQAPTLILAYYDPASGNVDFSVTCTEGYTDTVVAFYPKSADTGEKRPAALTLLRGEASFPIEATGQMFNGRYTIDGLTTMQPSLADLLLQGFTVAVDGKSAGTYAPTESDLGSVKRLTEACVEAP